MPPPPPPHVITRRSVASWVIYDLANTIFTMGIVSLYFSLWVRDSVGAERADSVYGTITAVSMGIIFVLSPLLGAMSDRASRRMPFLIVSNVLCVAFTLLLGRSGTTGAIIAFIVANAAYQAGRQFDDQMLAVDAGLSGARPARDDVEAGIGQMALEPAVEPDAIVIGGDGEGADRFAHSRVSHRPRPSATTEPISEAPA